MKVFITGGTGFIGSHLIDYLSNNAEEIYALVRDLNNLKWLKGKDIQFLEGNLSSFPSLPSDIKTVFHVAGLTKANKSADYYTVNQHGTASLFDALKRQRIQPEKVIILSSFAASGPSLDRKPVREDQLPHPITDYGNSKLLAEQEALKHKHDFPIVILRATAIFGPRDKDFLSYFQFIKKGFLLSLGFSPRFVSLCYVKDLVRACFLASQKAVNSGEVFHIADPKPYSWDEFGRLAENAFSKKLKKVNIPLFAAYMLSCVFHLKNKLISTPEILDLNKYKDMKQRYWITDTEKAKERLSFLPDYSISDAVLETVDWYLKEGWL
jgi:nucleoside-diphosphate-sugar epimerase